MNFVPICKVHWRYTCNTASQHSLLICSATSRYSFHASSILWGNQSACVSLSFHLPSWASTSVLSNNTRYNLQVETTEQLLAYSLQAFKAWHFFHGLPKHSPANILWKLFFPFLLKGWELFLLMVSSSWSMVHNKKSSTCPHWPYAMGAHRELLTIWWLTCGKQSGGKKFCFQSLEDASFS